MNNTDDLETIAAVLSGNTNAFGVLVNRYQHLSLTLAYNIILDKPAAEDVTQDAFVKAYTSLASFKGNSRFSTWLYRIVVNTALNKRKHRHFVYVDSIEAVADERDSIELEACLNKEERVKYIKLAMKNLPEAERNCLTMYYLNELSIEEVTLLTGFKTANVKVLLHRGRKHMFALLKMILKENTHDLI